MLQLGYEHNVGEWRLFIYSCKASLKAVFVQNGNKKPSVPLANTIAYKETYESMELLLKLMNYSKFEGHICGDLKVISL